ncbi:MAG: dTDP-4-dehydrorhamnose 3,5-epimerase family protein [Candidatus Micrarchaeota archaeon]
MVSKKNLLSGVRVIPLSDHSDKRGFFREIAKKSWKMPDIRQVSVSETKSGIIKAFHWHERQGDAWHLLKGKLIVSLHDLRKTSRDFGRTISFEWDAKKTACLLLIPKKVCHGYKAVGPKNALMLYMMDREYNPKKPDEKRIPFDDPKIGMNWKGQPKMSINDFMP